MTLELNPAPVPYEKKVVLKCPAGYRLALDQMVEDFLRDGVALVAVIGKDCAKVEDIIDELIVGDGSNPERFIVTTSHPGESLQDVVEFAESFSTDPAGKVQIVEL